jgi:hypothetical protein
MAEETNIYKRVKNWYTQKGISTNQFFEGNSTECALEEMVVDFAHRMLTKEDEVALSALKEVINPLMVQEMDRRLKEDLDFRVLLRKEGLRVVRE